MAQINGGTSEESVAKIETKVDDLSKRYQRLEDRMYSFQTFQVVATVFLSIFGIALIAIGVYISRQ